jgi:hypothetical protein
MQTRLAGEMEMVSICQNNESVKPFTGRARRFAI